MPGAECANDEAQEQREVSEVRGSYACHQLVTQNPGCGIGDAQRDESWAGHPDLVRQEAMRPEEERRPEGDAQDGRGETEQRIHDFVRTLRSIVQVFCRMASTASGLRSSTTRLRTRSRGEVPER